MKSHVKIIIIVAAVVILILVIMFFLGKKRLKKEEAADAKIEKLISEGRYAAAKCIIQSDVIYHDRVSLGKEQEEHLLYLDSLVEKCSAKIAEEKIDERAELGKFVMEIIPEADSSDFSFMLKYCRPDVNYQDEKGNTALMTAVRHNRLDIIRHLIDAEAHINAVDKEGKSALVTACNMGSYELVKYLVDKGADVTLQDRSGKKMLQQVSSESDDYVR